jgi:hypothetical protein
MANYSASSNSVWTGQQQGSPQLPMARSFVAPAPPEVIQVRREPQLPDWIGAAAPLDLPSFASSEGTREASSPLLRAQALRVRLLPFALLWAVIAIVLGVAVILTIGSMPGAGLTALLTFGALTAFSYYRMNGQDYTYSREGTERHKVDTVHALELAKMEHNLEVRRMAFDFYLKLLEREARRD